MKQFFILAFLCPILAASQPISIGEAVPDLPLNGLLNSPISKSGTGQFKDKLLIIDFWATYCSPCIRGLKKLDSLQQQFQNKLQVIAVTNQPANQVVPFITRRKWDIRFLPGDTLFLKWFPHNAIPHTVWIYNDTLRAITGSNELTAANITNILSGNSSAIKLKLDDMSFNIQKPLFVQGNGGDGSQQLYRSIITPYLPGLRFSAFKQRDTAGNISSIRIINASPLRLFREAYNNGTALFNYDNRLSIRVTSPDSLYFNPGKNYSNSQSWVEHNGFAYSLDLPPGWKGNPWQSMQEDLNRFFGNTLGFTAGIEKQKRMAWVVTIINPGAIPIAAVGTPQSATAEGNYMLCNHPFSDFIAALQYQNRNNPLPLVNETGICANVDLYLQSPLNDLGLLNEELHKYGLSITRKETWVETLVIKQQPVDTSNSITQN